MVEDLLTTAYANNGSTFVRNSNVFMNILYNRFASFGLFSGNTKKSYIESWVLDGAELHAAKESDTSYDYCGIFFLYAQNNYSYILIYANPTSSGDSGLPGTAVQLTKIYWNDDTCSVKIEIVPDDDGTIAYHKVNGTNLLKFNSDVMRMFEAAQLPLVYSSTRYYYLYRVLWTTYEKSN